MEKQNFLELDAIEVDQPLGKFCAVSIRASILCELAFSVPAKYSDKALTGTQRQIKEERTDKIAKFVNGIRATFPNSIILGANFYPNGELVDDEFERWKLVKSSSGVKLIIPLKKPLASIIDGQHRIEGFRKSFKNESEPQDMDLLCSIYFDLPSPEQAEIFATINYNQQKVDKSLAYQLFGYSTDDSKNSLLWPPETLAVYLCRLLNSNSTSPFKGLIKSGLYENHDNKKDDGIANDNKKKIELTVSTAAIVEGVVKLYSTDPVGDRYEINKRTFFGRGREVLKSIKSIAPLRIHYINGNDKAIYEIVENFFNAVKFVFWEKASPSSKVLSTIGILAMFDVLNHILKTIDITKDSCSNHSFANMLQQSGDIDFSDEFFNYAGIGRTQVRNIILLMIKSDHGIHKKKIDGINGSKDIERLNAVIEKYKRTDL